MAFLQCNIGFAWQLRQDVPKLSYEGRPWAPRMTAEMGGEAMELKLRLSILAAIMSFGLLAAIVLGMV